MHKKTIFIAITAMVLMLSSCMKNYTCQCTDSTGNMTMTTMKDTKNACIKQCNALGPNCELK